jgi:hypothetical protein
MQMHEWRKMYAQFRRSVQNLFDNDQEHWMKLRQEWLEANPVPNPEEDNNTQAQYQEQQENIMRDKAYARRLRMITKAHESGATVTEEVYARISKHADSSSSMHPGNANHDPLEIPIEHRRMAGGKALLRLMKESPGMSVVRVGEKTWFEDQDVSEHHAQRAIEIVKQFSRLHSTHPNTFPHVLDDSIRVLPQTDRGAIWVMYQVDNGRTAQESGAGLFPEDFE